MGLIYFVICFLFLNFIIQADTKSAVNHYCKTENNQSILKCYGDYPENVLYYTNIKEIYLVHLSWATLDLNGVLEKFPNVEKISIEYCDITSVVVSNKTNNVKELSLGNNKIKRLSQNFVKYFGSLKVINLENNRMTTMEENFFLGKLESLTIKNNPWNCSQDLLWALQLNKTIVKDLVNATCKQKYLGKNLLLIANYKEEMNQNCTKLCDCSLENMVQNPETDKQYPIVMVNCTGKGFRELPDQLPRHTRILHLERNEITDLRPLKTNPIFRSLWDLYLDNNTVKSIYYLEGSYWLQHFRVFSLRGNQLQKLPSFALDNALMKNPNMPEAVVLYLGNNPWRCDCIFVPGFQDLVLQKYSKRIYDINDVKCKYVEGDENSLLPINSLLRSSVCIVPNDFSLQQGLDLLNAVLASLIVFILGKLVYDYYHFKKSGRLPWIVTKMP